MLQLQSAVDPIVGAGVDLRAETESQSERDVVETSDADRLAVDTLPERRKGRDDEVEEAKKIGHVQGDDLDDGLGG